MTARPAKGTRPRATARPAARSPDGASARSRRPGFPICSVPGLHRPIRYPAANPTASICSSLKTDPDVKSYRSNRYRAVTSTRTRSGAIRRPTSLARRRQGL